MVLSTLHITIESSDGQSVIAKCAGEQSTGTDAYTALHSLVTQLEQKDIFKSKAVVVPTEVATPNPSTPKTFGVSKAFTKPYDKRNK